MQEKGVGVCLNHSVLDWEEGDGHPDYLGLGSGKEFGLHNPKIEVYLPHQPVQDLGPLTSLH